MSPVVLAELLSDQAFQPEHEKYLLQLPSLELGAPFLDASRQDARQTQGKGAQGEALKCR
jgi:hypothetical protein